MAKTETVTIPRALAAWALKFALAAASKDNVTPVLTAVRWRITHESIVVDATDRYRVHEATMNYTGPKRLGEFLMPRAMVEWILKTDHKKASHDPQLEISWKAGDEGTFLTARIVETVSGAAFSYELDGVKGNFPPVERLYPEPSRDGESFVPLYALNPSYVGDLALMVGRDEPVKIHAPREQRLPILFESRAARALIQQNRLTN